jgi:hypothetical protein
MIETKLEYIAFTDSPVTSSPSAIALPRASLRVMRNSLQQVLRRPEVYDYAGIDVTASSVFSTVRPDVPQSSTAGHCHLADEAGHAADASSGPFVQIEGRSGHQVTDRLA